MFGRATITLGIDPHSSLCNVLFLSFRLSLSSLHFVFSLFDATFVENKRKHIIITNIIIVPFLNTRQNAALAQSCLDKLIYKHYDHLMHLIIIILVRQVKQEDRTVEVELNTNMKEMS